MTSDAPPPRTLPRRHRLLGRADFRRVQGRGRRRVSRDLVVLALPNGLDHARFGLVVSRKVGNAVVRNRVKRWLREAIRHHRHGLTGLDFVFIARRGASAAGLHALERQVVAALNPLAGNTP